MFTWITNLFKRWKQNKERKQRLEELRKRDPFIYK